MPTGSPVSPAMLPHLPPEQVAESTRGLLTLASELGLPRELVERAQAVAAATGQDAMQDGAFAFDDEVSLWPDVTLPRWLGHSSPTVTLGYYAHFMSEAGSKRRTAVDGLLGRRGDLHVGRNSPPRSDDGRFPLWRASEGERGFQG